MMKRFTKQENSWVLYDWANSAYSIVVTTAVFPLFYKSAVAESGVSAPNRLPIWAIPLRFQRLFSPCSGRF